MLINIGNNVTLSRTTQYCQTTVTIVYIYKNNIQLNNTLQTPQGYHFKLDPSTLYTDANTDSKLDFNQNSNYY